METMSLSRITHKKNQDEEPIFINCKKLCHCGNPDPYVFKQFVDFHM